MLKNLKVKNLAVIEDIDVNFSDGFNAITGQTGAGKSLLIDSISLLLGARADQDLIRYGEKEAYIIGTFTNPSEKVKYFLESLGIKLEEDLIIQRKISNQNKNIIKVYDQNITLNDLKKLGILLGDIQVQHDIYRLINKENYLSFLDDYNDNKFLKLLNKYSSLKFDYQEYANKYFDVLKKKNDLKEKMDILLFQQKEIGELNLEENIDVKLEEEIAKLSNYDKIYQNINESYEALNNEYFNLDNLYQIKEKLEKIKEYDAKYNELYQLVNDSYYNLDSVNSDLYEIKDNLDFDPNYLDSLNQRLYDIDKIKIKYHMNVKELMDYYEKISLDIKLETNFDQTIKELENNLKNKFDLVYNSAKELSDYRKNKASLLEKRIMQEASLLDLENTKFKVKFNLLEPKDYKDKNSFLESGIDDIDFYVSFNVGEDIKPLAKVASGGELSRLMLAFKIIYLENNQLSFMVFDEIDSGISGLTARKIGRKLKELSKNVQVFAITHLANVASLANNHLFIEKIIDNGRTKTVIKTLNMNERIEEIALMLGGITIDSDLLNSAKKMIEE